MKGRKTALFTAFTCAALLVCTPAALADGHHNSDTTDWAHLSGPHRTHDRAWGDHGDRALHYGDLRDAVWMDRDDEDADDDSSGSDDAGDENSDDSSDDTTGTSVEAETGAEASLGGTVLTGAEQRLTARITGFGKIDNTPRGSTTISQGVIHSEAGGTGTFADALTAASPGSAGNTEFPKGTKFYVPHISRYVIIEDSGASKFDQPHLDIWSGTTDNVEDCESKITGTFEVIKNPKAGYPVKAGPIATGSGCNI